MSEEGRDRFEIPKDMRSMAEASVDQARKAFDKFLASAQQTAGRRASSEVSVAVDNNASPTAGAYGLASWP